MCGRYVSMQPPEALRRIFGTTGVFADLSARYNIAPTQAVLAVRFNRDTRERSLDLLRWGLIPHWAKDPSIGVKLINARAETITEKPAFRQAFAKRRCLIPADAFYEWKTGTKPKQPYAISLSDGRPFAFAGLWENWKGPEGIWVRTCTIITTSANALMVPLHDRMPVILDPVDYGMWLGEEEADQEQILALLRPFPADRMKAVPVSRDINDVRLAEPSLLTPLPELL
ncbi:SOS response-associated peptidase [Telmatospirillum sp.]|uniref:SOS response-associated peptidase n=1 Tax=Telmatospirillum sp. TaxID=2079197 RepID=UPI00283F0793|nr:SOS response-associated peptidase [Telmatospirillum sp.]MDR3438842.1 SOS response-associated peptidase [Telmatospirillum sp.]